YAAADGDPATSWTAPQRVVQHKTPPTLTLALPHPTEVTGLRLTTSGMSLPAQPTMVAVDLGDGPQIRELNPSKDQGPQTYPLAVQPRITDTVTISLLAWSDLIDRTALGFDQLKPPGLAEVLVLGGDGRPVSPANAAGNRARHISIDCDHGPIIAIAGRFVHTSVTTTVGALLAGEPVAARACEREPLTLPAGQQELLISPGAEFVVDGAQLAGPLAADLPEPALVAAETTAWSPTRRELRWPAKNAVTTAQILVVPESMNPGWVAHTSSGTRLTPVAVNGWQQGWVVPAGTSGTITLTYTVDALYRVGVVGGLALLPLLALLAVWAPRRRAALHHGDSPAQPWAPARTWAAAAALTSGIALAGAVGLLVFGAALGVQYALRQRREAQNAVTAWLSAGGVIAAGVVLSRQPWRSVESYAGHAPAVQLLALISVAMVTAAATRCGLAHDLSR
ncbi:MAG: hypothetical protein K2Q25_06385, partial [Mycobacteriaceae bacterium]|nr:hypothetical protein [Mycobacteriaceae bacterium]